MFEATLGSAASGALESPRGLDLLSSLRQCPVGRPLKGLPIEGVLWKNGDSHAQADASIDHGDSNSRDGGSEPNGCLFGTFQACGWQKNEELFPSISTSEVAGAKRVGERHADGGEVVVTSAVSKPVVYLLEMI